MSVPRIAGFSILFLVLSAAPASADVGDPQVRTDHPWYPGELACSTFERLFATQAELYQRVVGIRPATDEQKALAAWLWRNAHYYHGEAGAENLWGQGFTRGGEMKPREYWTGLFAHGHGLCGTSHAQWSAEMESLLGHNRGRVVGVVNHNAFEVFLTGGLYGKGKWVLLDHDQSTVVFDAKGTSLLSMQEIQRDWKRLTSRTFLPDRQRGWLVCGIHPNDCETYREYNTVEYLPGYSGVPPMVHLRRGETLRRYLQPGLIDGKTFVFWGRNSNVGGIPGPERDRTWVNQPAMMHGSRDGAGSRPGQARYGNAVYTYRPDFTLVDYREGVIDEDDEHVTFEFYSPYIIAATPPTDEPWSIYEPGCKNGLVLHGKADCKVAISTDQGKTWKDGGKLAAGLDITDYVKGHRQYFIRFGAGAKALAGTGLTMTTVCQASESILPRLKEGGSRVRFESSGQAVVSAGPTRAQAQPHVVDGAFETHTVTLEATTPRKEPVLAVYAAAHVASGNPPNPEVKYQIDYSIDGGKAWKPIVQDWTINRRGEEPKDFWSQSLCYGSATLAEPSATPVRVRFHNTGRRSYLRAEMHLVYRTGKDATRATFAWTDDAGPRQASQVMTADKPAEWEIKTGRNVQTRWVEFEPSIAQSHGRR